MSALPSHQRQYTPSDFLFGPTLGEGRFGTVIYAELNSATTLHHHCHGHDGISEGKNEEHNTDGARPSPGHINRKGYAIKMIPKSEILRHNQTRAVLTEKFVLSEILTSPTPATAKESANSASELIMKLYLCFHDANCLYFVLELCAGGTLLDAIQFCVNSRNDVNDPVMEISWVRYYAGQILRALEYLHQRGVVHRDLTPQNIGLMYPNGEIKLGDFGAANAFVQVNKDGEMELQKWEPPGVSASPRKTSELRDDFVGTADYVSPEMLRGEGGECSHSCQNYENNQFLDRAMDLWSFGCLIFNMIVGESPFHAPSDHLSFQNVLKYANGESDVQFPPFVNDELHGLIASLLSRDPGHRLGMADDILLSAASNKFQTSNNHYNSIRDHVFFHTDKITPFWHSLENGNLDPPFKPSTPNWMDDFHALKSSLKPLDDIGFDL